MDSGDAGTSAIGTDRPSVYNFINDRHTDMRPNQLPANYDFGIKAKKKQVGKQPSKRGVIYFMTSASNAITADDTEWVAVKIGLASGGEAEAFKVLSNHRTSNDGDTTYHALLTVTHVGRAESRIHQRLRGMGYSTLHGSDSMVPERYRKFYAAQAGGSEWFVLPMSLLNEIIAEYRETLTEPAPWVDGWIGQSEQNDPVRFCYNSDGMPVQVDEVRQGRPVQQQAVAFAYTYRYLTGFAPEGCCLA